MRGQSVQNFNKKGRAASKPPAVFIPLDVRKQAFAHLAARKKRLT